MIKVSKGCLGEEELAQVKEAFEYGYFGMAHKVTAFEDELKAYLGAKNVLAVNTGTSALHLVLDAIGVGAGDEVLVPSLTFVASFQAISATGATPVACEVYEDTLLMDIEDVKRRITPRTKAIMPVHYAGTPCNLDALLELKAERGIRIVEDAAHALGSTYHGKKVGSFGDIACFSFDSIKNITCGEGGAIAFQDDDLAPILKAKRLVGMEKDITATDWKARGDWYEVRTQGYRYHMSNINAAIGLAQLKKLDGFNARRREICQMYDEAFRASRLVCPLPTDYRSTAPHIYPIRVMEGQRDAIQQHLKDRDIECKVNYVPCHLFEFYSQDSLPVTEKAYGEILCLPLHCGLSDEDVGTVIHEVGAFEGHCHALA